MRKAFLLGAILMAVGMFAACTSDDDYSELIVGKWLPEYAYNVDLETGETERIDYENVPMIVVGDDGVTFDTIYVTPDKYVMEFKADGTMYNYKYGESAEADTNPRTYTIEGHFLVIHAVIEYENTVNEMNIYHNIQTLNKKTLDIYQDIDGSSSYDSPEPVDVHKTRHHMVYKRI